MLKSILTWAVLASLACASLALADPNDAELAALREQIRVLSARLDQLERAQRAGPALASPPATARLDTVAVEDLDRRIDEVLLARSREAARTDAWTARIRPSGDFRYRYEDNAVQRTGDWNRHRMRARLSLQADVAETVRAEFALASGNDLPVSANQTLGAAGSTKEINLDLAYVSWTGIPATTVMIGKHRNPFLRVGNSELIWDRDWRPEGIAIQYDPGQVFVNAIGTWMQSDSRLDNREFALGLQSGLRFPLGDRVQATAGASYYEIESAGRQPFFGVGNLFFFGNSFDSESSTYRYDYREVEAFAELTFQLGGRLIRVFGDWVDNVDASAHDTGYEVGVRYGEAKSRGTWELGYSYRKVDADAVFGLLTGSDFATGGSDSRGSILQGIYAFDDNWNLQVTYIAAESRLRNPARQDFDRLQVDLNFRYR